jgi:hypothetical protein
MSCSYEKKKKFVNPDFLILCDKRGSAVDVFQTDNLKKKPAVQWSLSSVNFIQNVNALDSGQVLTGSFI